MNINVTQYVNSALLHIVHIININLKVFIININNFIFLENDHNFQRLPNKYTISKPTLSTELNEGPYDSDVTFGKYIVALMKDIPIKKRKKLQYQFIASVISAQDPK